MCGQCQVQAVPEGKGRRDGLMRLDKADLVTRVLQLEGEARAAQAQTATLANANANATAPDPPCNGSGYAHKPHGNCPGYSTDRT